MSARAKKVVKPMAAALITVRTAPVTIPALYWSQTLCGGKNVTHAKATEACAALGEGWRLPTVEELLSLVDRSKRNPAIDTERFPDTKSDWYWTSTDSAWSADYAWVVSFNAGGAYLSPRYSLACVRAVRSVPAGQ